MLGIMQGGGNQLLKDSGYDLGMISESSLNLCSDFISSFDIVFRYFLAIIAD